MFPIKIHFLFISIHPRVYFPLKPLCEHTMGLEIADFIFYFLFFISDNKLKGFCQAFHIVNLLGVSIRGAIYLYRSPLKKKF